MDSPTANRDAGEGLVMRTVASPEDVERVAAFDAAIHGATTEATWRALMTLHPERSLAAWLLVEEGAGGPVVASLCLLPWRLHYQGVELRAAEMGVVGTLETQRGRGLQRLLNRRFDELLRAGGYQLSHIQGIPYFYRQFGYEYAMPLEAWWRLETHMLPVEPPAGYSCRLATLDDLAALMALYDEAARALDIAALRDEAVWRYLLGPGLDTILAAPTWVIADGAGRVVGSMRIARHGFGDGLIVAEASLLAPEAAMAALATLRRLTIEADKPFVRLNLPAETPLVTVARGLGAYDGGAYAWQVRLPEPVGLLRALAPAFEARLRDSIYAGLTRELVIGLYREAIALRFVAGRLAGVAAVAPGTPADLRLPPPLLAPLVLGHRTLTEIAHMYPDASAARSSEPLVACLFPRLRSWLYQPY